MFPKSKSAPEGVSVPELLDTLRLFLAYVPCLCHSESNHVRKITGLKRIVLHNSHTLLPCCYSLLLTVDTLWCTAFLMPAIWITLIFRFLAHICQWNREHEVDFVLLAGYLKLIPAELVREYPRSILNIHPSLLPAFGGKGYYGLKVHKAVVSSGAR